MTGIPSPANPGLLEVTVRPWARLPYWLQLAVLFIAIWVVFSPARKHFPHSDQMNFFLDTGGREEFVDLVAHTYSYNRTRVSSPGDTPLFRPLFFVWLSGLKAAFGTHFEHCQTTGIVLHGVNCFLLFLLLRHIFGLNKHGEDWRSPYSLLPFSLVFFYALNYAIIEQVIWFNIQAYLLAIAMMLGSTLLIAKAVADDGMKNQSLKLSASWLLALLASFTYELGQFFAIAAGLFVLVMLPAGRRRWAVCAAFLSVALIYQTANQTDRWVHRTCVDDVGVADVIKKATPLMTLEHGGRFAFYTLVQPFLPCPLRLIGKGSSLSARTTGIRPSSRIPDG